MRFILIYRFYSFFKSICILFLIHSVSYQSIIFDVMVLVLGHILKQLILNDFILNDFGPQSDHVLIALSIFQRMFLTRGTIFIVTISSFLFLLASTFIYRKEGHYTNLHQRSSTR